MLRFLVQCAFVAVRNDEKFRQFYERIKQRKGPQNSCHSEEASNSRICLRDRKPYVSRPQTYYGEELAVTNWARV